MGIEWLSKHKAPFGSSPSNITIYGESTGSLSVETQIHSLLPARFSRAIMQSQVLGAPLFSTPQTIQEKTVVYTAVKEKLKISTHRRTRKGSLARSHESLPSLRSKEWTCWDIDDGWNFDGWRVARALLVERAFAAGKYSCGKGTVVRLVMSQYPIADPRPSTTALIDTLSIISAEKADAILKAIQYHTGKQVERRVWCPAENHRGRDVVQTYRSVSKHFSFLGTESWRICILSSYSRLGYA
jgi:hypothetical protein